MNELVKILTWVFSGTGIGGLSLILYFFKNPDKFERGMAVFYRIAYTLSSSFPKIKYKIDRNAVASSIQDSVNGVCEQIDKQAPDVLPHALKIEWVQSETPESFIKNGRCIVRLKHYANQDRNIVDSTLWYLKAGLLPGSRSYLDRTLRESCEFKVATQVFIAKRDTGAYDYFFENILNPALNAHVDLKQDLQVLDDLESVGFFTRVFLTEVKQTGEKLLGTMPTHAIQQELRNLAVFLQTIANKERHEKVPLIFNGVKVKAAVVLVADKKIIDKYGIRPYINRTARRVREGYDSIYVNGWGEEFIKKVLEIKSKIEGDLVTVLRRYIGYPIKGQTKGILLACQSNLTYLARRRELQEEVKQALVDIVPEIKSGAIEIVSIAGIKNVGCKIAVRAAQEGDTSDVVRVCIGENNERLAALRVRLANEFVGIIRWSENIKEFIINALLPLKESYVDSIEIDEEQLVANVKVISNDEYSKALGKGHFNLKFASELTGWEIIVEGPKRIETKPTPDEELREILTTRVPQIENNKIEIVGIGRIKGVGSKVSVKWKVKHKEGVLAYKICVTRLRAIPQEIIGEWLHFCEHDDDPRKLLVGSLYPLMESDVDSVNLNYENNTATITITDTQKSSPVWRSQYNLALAEKVTGWGIEIREKA